MKKILIVEDEDNLRKLYQQELSENQYDVVAVPDGQQALETLRKKEINLVVLDIKLDTENGLDLLREMMNENRNLKVVINTAYPAYKFDFSTWCADAYLIKSSDFSELKNTISNLLAE